MSIFLDTNLLSCYLSNLIFKMIDNLISHQTKKIRLKKACILKVMNFLIFRDFFRIFPNFSRFF